MNSPGINLAVCGGGTGGHIFPALAVVAALRKKKVGDKIYYLGRKQSLEETLANKHDLPFYGLELASWNRRNIFKNFSSILKAMLGLYLARKLLKKLKIRAILGTGGYVCGPIILAAITLGIPAIIHESNLKPGLTNKLLALWVKHIAVTYAETSKYFSAYKNKIIVTGFPLRLNLTQLEHKAGCEYFGLDPAKPVWFIFPGSLAASKINKVLLQALPVLEEKLPELQLLWMAGKKDLAEVKAASQKSKNFISVHEFIHAVPEAYAAADIILARAGASTIAEISISGKPAILVPYPYATGDHQTYNARELCKQGVAEIVTDTEVNVEKLLLKLEKMLGDLSSLKVKAKLLKQAYPKQAANDLADLMFNLVKEKK